MLMTTTKTMMKMFMIMMRGRRMMMTMTMTIPSRSGVMCITNLLPEVFLSCQMLNTNSCFEIW